ncbi:hypothetical protein VMT65_04840 [Nocardia sp. CDC153]|uniref:hypothetical protein n=1 Tax=Nocardia sp. CDC153 TaxID=3112167 RepID=UPI002DBBC8F9|nr:hypothetical protein [Nocardia sp. CDC153]MEC3952356.1 hypothetical protein [Nocardia sp. CDC153]
MTEVMPATGRETAPVAARPVGVIAAQRIPANPTLGPTRRRIHPAPQGDTVIATALHERYAR